MSLKRYALLSAISYHNSHNANNATKNQSTQNSTIATSIAIESTPAATIAIPETLNHTATTLLATATNQTSSTKLATPKHASNSAIAHGATSTTTTTTTATTFTTYNGGIGLYHQHTIRGSNINNAPNNIILYANSLGNNGVGSGAHNPGSGFPNGNFYMNGNVNLLLGGAMLSLITTILCVVCYCCHRNIKKRTEAAYRQQRQWLDNDPNMEIYSVEQCYETSGLFISDSTDGLATIPALHHEPPPSYDAVVAMQEQQLLQQQQQQLLLQQQLQRSSPPPGYRSSLDVSTMPYAQHVAGGRGTPDGMAATTAAQTTHDSQNDSYSNLTALNQSNMPLAQQYKQQHGAASAETTATNSGGNGQRNPMNQQLLRKVLNAQSCCSLQRAEVENMWNAANAAVANRAQHQHQTASSNLCSSTGGNELTTLTSHSFPARKPAATAPRLSVHDIGRRYLNQNYYRRGCPLCGKFRYNDDVDEAATLTLSTESGLNLTQPQTLQANANPMDCMETVLGANCRRSSVDNAADSNGNNSCSGCSNNRSNSRNIAANTKAASKPRTMNVATTNGNECGSSNTVEPITNSATPAATLQQDQLNGNSVDEPSTSPLILITNEAPDLNANNNNSNNHTLDCDIHNDTANANWSATAELRPRAQDGAHAASVTPTTSTTASVSTAIPCHRQLNLENPLVNLDICRIIDNTGLPSYEGAIKLESSGYV